MRDWELPVFEAFRRSSWRGIFRLAASAARRDHCALAPGGAE
jgi:hypothetical protein